MKKESRIKWTTCAWPDQKGPPKEPGIYLTLVFDMGSYRYPRLTRILRGKTGKLYIKEQCGKIYRDIQFEFSGTCWCKISDPDGEDDFINYKYSPKLGAEWSK